MDKRVAGVLVVLIIFTVIFLSSGQSLNKKIVSAIDGVESYRVSTEAYVTTKGVVDGVPVDSLQEVNAVGATDVAGRKMMVYAVSRGGAASEENMSIYLINSTIYTKSGDQWLIQKTPAGYDVWGSHYQLKQLARIINQSKLEVISKKDGILLIDVKTDRDSLVEFIKEQSVSSPLQNAEDIANSLKEVHMNVSVNEKTMLPQEFRMSMVMGQSGLVRSTSIVMKMWDYGKNMDVSLPQEISKYNVAPRSF